MAKRVESPSSINTFKQCQRKYYFQYIEKLPTKKNIHLVRGNIVHSVLEDFYDIDVSKFDEDDYQIKFRAAIQQLLVHQWKKYQSNLSEVNMSEDKLKFYFEESMMMCINWYNYFIQEFKKLLSTKQKTIQEIFHELTPIREEEYRSEQHSVRGFIDAIKLNKGEAHIIDYKTNARSEIKESIILQLSIYSLLYQEKHGKIPEQVGIFFLRDKLKMLPSNEEMIKNAKFEIEAIHSHTTLTEEKGDYKKNITPLCKWRTGQCDFYDICKPRG
ncbi:PD-(D/E)XK nuclease family protein [archaeon]|jgi:CRISPR/Cas system-associated exonuclease Cas4 (RecB family)|nr:PD-(D/E)XK nuclease family protein [archaeon]MBT3451438.1 PD-(D/E)XK nuclease family protein [archaeon]MBT6869718.1 PD-(D/E)XK nuclease family protein [archaeon]MBT7192647.1 PD-(D/E)XK nuclease family protein [archaeon]MBT7380532.1 PD-(D/E)XK nuclease family protein [archaeon]